jgi:hypothetical protein
MRLETWTAAVAVWALSGSVACAQHPHWQRFVERTPPLKHPQPTPCEPFTPQVARWAIPGVTRFEAGGYVGGGCLKGHNVCAKGATVASGPVQDGTFGLDFAGFKLRAGRVFLAPSGDPSRTGPIARNYNSEGPNVLDVFALRPLRKAVLEKKEAVEEHKGEGGEHHGEAGGPKCETGGPAGGGH